MSKYPSLNRMVPMAFSAAETATATIDSGGTNSIASQSSSSEPTGTYLSDLKVDG